MKKDVALMVVALLLMVGCSSTVKDSRYMEVEKQLQSDLLQRIEKQVNKHIDDVHYLVSAPKETEEPLTVEKAPVQSQIEVSVIEENLSEEIAEVEQTYKEPGLVYIGDYRITAYEWTGNPCANGNYPSEGYTVACNDLPFGTEVYTDGVGWRVVEDRGGGGEGWMDLYLGDIDACYDWGVQYRSVYIYE